MATAFTADLGQKLQTTLALDVKNFTNHAAKARYQPFSVMQDLQPQQVARFQEQFAGTPGVDLEMQTIRTYPHGTMAAHLIGYLKREKDGESRDGEESYYSYRLPDYRGLIGIEGGYDEKLCGHAGGKSVLVNNLGYRQSENIWQPTVPGYNATLTLDLRMQQAAERALARSPSGRGAIVVMDTRNGDVLALASSPTFNPNHWVDGFPPGELDVIQLTVPRNLRLEPFRKGVDALGPYPVQTTGIFVGPLVELSARMELCQNDFGSGDAFGRMQLDGNAAAVVDDGHAVVDVDLDVDRVAMSCERFVDRVVDDLEQDRKSTRLNSSHRT